MILMDNILISTDPTGNVKLDKERPTEKIDRAVFVVGQVSMMKGVC
jgi:hypothetical protein